MGLSGTNVEHPTKSFFAANRGSHGKRKEQTTLIIWGAHPLHQVSVRHLVESALGTKIGFRLTRVISRGRQVDTPIRFECELVGGVSSPLTLDAMLLTLRRATSQYGWFVQPWQSYATRLADRVAGAGPVRPLVPQVGESGRTLGLLHLNVNSLAAKLDDVLMLCEKRNVQCLSLNEVYGPNATLEPGHRYQLPGMIVFQGPYDPGEAGSHGVAFAAAKSLNAVEYSASTTTAVFVLIRESGCQPLLTGLAMFLRVQTELPVAKRLLVGVPWFANSASSFQLARFF
jgi:hypothetical protein